MDVYVIEIMRESRGLGCHLHGVDEDEHAGPTQEVMSAQGTQATQGR